MARPANVDRNQIVEMYRNGMTQMDIADQMNLSPSSVCYHLHKAGIRTGKGGACGTHDPQEGLCGACRG